MNASTQLMLLDSEGHRLDVRIEQALAALKPRLQRAMISSRIRPFQRPAWNAVKYASGNAMIKHRIVASGRVEVERRNCSA